MKKNTDPLLPDTYYHIYNRGVNGTRLFTKKGNADYFLEKYVKYITPIAETYAYVLMGNHFHFLIKTKKEEDVKEFYQNYKGSTNVGEVQNLADVKHDNLANVRHNEIRAIHKILGNQFAKLFNSYAQSINKQDKRTGQLFEEPFRRIPIQNGDYLRYMVYYIHYNPVKHGFTNDFRLYTHSSYSVFLDKVPDFIDFDTVLSWFGGLDAFLIYHGVKHDFDEKWYDENWIEAD
jgi:putative transposase